VGGRWKVEGRLEGDGEHKGIQRVMGNRSVQYTTSNRIRTMQKKTSSTLCQ